MKVALVQMDLAEGEPDRNARTAASMLRLANSDAADLALLPELWASGYDLEAAERHAAPLGEGALAVASHLAAEHKLHVCGSLLERSHRCDRRGACSRDPAPLPVLQRSPKRNLQFAIACHDTLLKLVVRR